MRPNWPKLARPAQKNCLPDSLQFLVLSLLPKDDPFIEDIEFNYSW